MTHSSGLYGRRDEELKMLIVLARRFAPPDYPVDAPVVASDLQDLGNWSGALIEALEYVLPSNRALWFQAAEAREDNQLLVGLWEQVGRLPERDLDYLVKHAINNRPLLRLREPYVHPCGEWF